VTWKKRGSVILIEDAIPKYNIAEERYFAPKDAYYYIIDYGGGEYFLREVDEIYAYLQANISKSRIAVLLNVHRSTVYREIKRNTVQGKYHPEKV